MVRPSLRSDSIGVIQSTSTQFGIVSMLARDTANAQVLTNRCCKRRPSPPPERWQPRPAAARRRSSRPAARAVDGRRDEHEVLDQSTKPGREPTSPAPRASSAGHIIGWGRMEAPAGTWLYQRSARLRPRRVGEPRESLFVAHGHLLDILLPVSPTAIHKDGVRWRAGYPGRASPEVGHDDLTSSLGEHHEGWTVWPTVAPDAGHLSSRRAVAAAPAD